jgi:osmotically inducible protein OsmC
MEVAMTQFDNSVYIGSINTISRRVLNGSDGLSEPSRSNPRQGLAAGWSDAFIDAMARAARRLNVALPAGTSDEVEIDLVFRGGAFFLRGRHNVSLPGLERDVARAVIDVAHQTASDTTATRNIIVEINLI